MAVTAFDGLCRTLDAQLETIVKTLQKIEDTIKPILDVFDDTILQFQADQLIGPGVKDAFDDVASQVIDNMNDLVPQDLDELASLIQSCPYLSQNELLSDAATFVKTIEGNLMEAAMELVQAFNTLLDWGLAVRLNGILITFENFKLSSLSEEINKIKQCLRDLCEYDITAKVNEIDRIFLALGLTSNGTFDLSDYLAGFEGRTGIGLDPDDVATIQTQYDTWKNIQDNINDSIEAASRSFKALF